MQLEQQILLKQDNNKHNKAVRISIRINENKYNELKQKALDNNLRISTFIRQDKLLFNGHLNNHTIYNDLRVLVKSMRNNGNNINQQILRVDTDKFNNNISEKIYKLFIMQLNEVKINNCNIFNLIIMWLADYKNAN